MALINCPECGNQVSDKANQCIHCGYPLRDKDGIYETINGIEYDLSFLKDIKGTKVDRIPYIQRVSDLTGLDKVDSVFLISKLVGHFPQSKDENKPKCPTCQSTNIVKIDALERVASVTMFGLFSKKINKTFKCNNCGHTW